MATKGQAYLLKVGTKYALFDESDKLAADAPLSTFAASPEMLEALELIVELVNTSLTHITEKKFTDAVTRVNTAIKKAKGH